MQFYYLKKCIIINYYPVGEKKHSLSIGYSINSLHKPDTVWWGIWTASRSLKAFTSLLGAVHNMDRFTGASMDQSADPHSAPESGDLLAALRVTRPLSISTHLPVFCDRPLDCVGLSKLVMAHIFREDTALCEQSFSMCKTISKRWRNKVLSTG